MAAEACMDKKSRGGFPRWPSSILRLHKARQTRNGALQHINMQQSAARETHHIALAPPPVSSLLLLLLRAVHVAPSSAAVPTKATRTSLITDKWKGRVKHSKHESVAGDNLGIIVLL